MSSGMCFNHYVGGGGGGGNFFQSLCQGGISFNHCVKGEFLSITMSRGIFI